MRLFVALAVLVWSQIAVPSRQADTTPAELSVNASALLHTGEIRRVARTALTLLNADFGEKLAQVYPEGPQSLQAKGQAFLLRKLYSAAPRRDGRSIETGVAEMEEFIKAHTVATARTDSDGNATIQSAPGNYFLFGAFEMDFARFAIWSVPIQLKAGKNRLVLDHSNALK